MATIAVLSTATATNPNTNTNIVEIKEKTHQILYGCIDSICPLIEFTFNKNKESSQKLVDMISNIKNYNNDNNSSGGSSNSVIDSDINLYLDPIHDHHRCIYLSSLVVVGSGECLIVKPLLQVRVVCCVCMCVCVVEVPRITRHL